MFNGNKKKRKRESYFWHVRMVVIIQLYKRHCDILKRDHSLSFISTKPHGEKDITKYRNRETMIYLSSSKYCFFLAKCIEAYLVIVSFHGQNCSRSWMYFAFYNCWKFFYTKQLLFENLSTKWSFLGNSCFRRPKPNLTT